MRKQILTAVSLCLVLSLLLTGCGVVDFGAFFDRFGQLLAGGVLTDFSDMEYTRPDMSAFDAALTDVLQAAGEEKKLDRLIEEIYSFYDAYDSFYTNYALANIYYSKDLRDSYWEAEYNYVMEHAGTVDAALDSLYRALAQSPLREKLEGDSYFGPDFFDAYEGDSLYDDYFKGLLKEEAQLQTQYYAISSEAAAVEYYSEEFFSIYGAQLAEVYVDMIAVRQKMAAHAGYESYPEFAYDFYFGRDYSPQEATSYMADIRAELVPLYKQISQSSLWAGALQPAGEQETYRYVQQMAQAMGGTVLDAFTAMEKGGLYDITYSNYKADTSFEIFLSKYYTPYIFLNPTGNNLDKLTFAHEFGHFCADYVSAGSLAGVDVAEVFSQGMEYLSLCYVEDEALKKLKMASCLAVYVEQSAYASFEQQVYSLEGERLNAENVRALYEKTCIDYGLSYTGWDSREYVCVPHFFISPMYIISYVVSNDVALQIYMLEQEEAGEGLACLTDNLSTAHAGIQAFVQEAGLKSSPFADGWLLQVKKTLEEALQ